MLPNPFLTRFGPSIEETGLRPEGPDLDAISFALAERDRQDAIRQVIDAQHQGTREAGFGSLTNIAGQGLGRLARPVLRPLAQSARSGLSNLLSYGKSSPVTIGAKPVAAGGNTLLTAATRPTTTGVQFGEFTGSGAALGTPSGVELGEFTGAGSSLGESAGTSVGSVATDGASLLGSLGKVLGTGAAAYGAFEGIRSGLSANDDLDDFLHGDLTREQERDARQASHDAGMVGVGTGAATGALAGTALAPGIGTALGAILGAAGGMIQSSGSHDNAADAAKARLKFMKNPFKKH